MPFSSPLQPFLSTAQARAFFHCCSAGAAGDRCGMMRRPMICGDCRRCPGHGSDAVRQSRMHWRMPRPSAMRLPLHVIFLQQGPLYWCITCMAPPCPGASCQRTAHGRRDGTASVLQRPNRRTLRNLFIFLSVGREASGRAGVTGRIVLYGMARRRGLERPHIRCGIHASSGPGRGPQKSLPESALGTTVPDWLIGYIHAEELRRGKNDS